MKQLFFIVMELAVALGADAPPTKLEKKPPVVVEKKVETKVCTECTTTTAVKTSPAEETRVRRRLFSRRRGCSSCAN